KIPFPCQYYSHALHDALPIWRGGLLQPAQLVAAVLRAVGRDRHARHRFRLVAVHVRSRRRVPVDDGSGFRVLQGPFRPLTGKRTPGRAGIRILRVPALSVLGAVPATALGRRTDRPVGRPGGTTCGWVAQDRGTGGGALPPCSSAPAWWPAQPRPARAAATATGRTRC